jgi:hypothetical protein
MMFMLSSFLKWDEGPGSVRTHLFCQNTREPEGTPLGLGPGTWVRLGSAHDRIINGRFVRAMTTVITDPNDRYGR